MTDPNADELRIARLVRQVGDLEAQLDAHRAALARARRHRGNLTGFLRDAIQRGLFAGDVADLADRILAELADVEQDRATPIAPRARA